MLLAACLWVPKLIKRAYRSTHLVTQKKTKIFINVQGSSRSGKVQNENKKQFLLHIPVCVCSAVFVWLRKLKAVTTGSFFGASCNSVQGKALSIVISITNHHREMGRQVLLLCLAFVCWSLEVLPIRIAPKNLQCITNFRLAGCLLVRSHL